MLQICTNYGSWIGPSHLIPLQGIWMLSSRQFWYLIFKFTVFIIITVFYLTVIYVLIILASKFIISHLKIKDQISKNKSHPKSYITIILTLERYLAISRPMKYHAKIRKTKIYFSTRVLAYVQPVVLFALIFSIPNFFGKNHFFYVHK